MRRHLHAAALLAGLAAAAPAAEADDDLLQANGLLEPSEGLAPAPLLPSPLASFGATRVGGWLYAYSGHRGPVHAHSVDNLWDGFGRLNLLDGKTWELLPCPLPLQSAALVAHEGLLYRVGGLSARNRSGEQEDLWSVASVQRFDPLTGAWTDLPDLPERRSSHDAVVLDGHLYVVGGWSIEGDRVAWHRTGWRLDLSAAEPAWEALPEAPFEHRALALAACDERILAMGGMTSMDELTAATWILDPTAGTWSQGPDLPFKGFGAAAAVIGRDVYASGLDSHLFRLGLYGDDLEWEDLGSLIFPRYFHRLVSLDDERLLAVGGVTRPGGHLRHIEVLDLRSDRPSPRMTGWVLPIPGRAKNRQGLFLHRNSLYLFGGNDSLEQHAFGPEHFLDEGWRVRLPTFEVERLGAFPERRQSMVSLVVGGEAPQGLLVGGFGHTGEGTRSWPDVFTYDFAEGTWTRRDGALPQNRTQLGLVEHGEAVYAFGGVDYDSSRGREEAFRFPQEVLVAEEGAFVPAGFSLPQPRRAFGAALVGDRYYLIGGMQAGFSLVEDVDVWDFEAEAWTKATAPTRPRISPEVAALGGKIYVAGGSSPAGEDFAPNPSLEAYDPATDTWTVLVEALPVPVTHMRMHTWRDRLLITSTHVEGAQALRLLVIDPR